MVNNSVKNLILDKIGISTFDPIILNNVFQCVTIGVQVNNGLPPRCLIDVGRINGDRHPRADDKKGKFLIMAKSLREFDSNDNPIKFCTGCNQWLPENNEFFIIDKTAKYGFKPRCKECVKYRAHNPKKAGIEPGHKRCSTCGDIFPETEEYFHKGANSKTGLISNCKVCARKRSRTYYQKNTEYVKEREKRYKETHWEEIAKKRKKKPKVEDNIEPGYKRCFTCKEVFPETSEYFSRSKVNKGGFYGSCKVCKSKIDKIYRENHKEEKRERDGKYKEEHREEINARANTYYHENKVEISIKSKGRYRKNRTKILQATKRYYQTARGLAVKKASAHNHRARKKNAEGTLTKEQIEQKLKAQKFRCYYSACGHAKFEKKNDRYIFHLEHTIPVSRTEEGPRNDVNFVVLSCPACNMSKGDKCPWEWAQGGRLF